MRRLAFVGSLNTVSSSVYIVVTAIHLLAQRPKRLAGKDGLDRESKILRQRKGQRERRSVIAALEKADGLVIHIEIVSQILARQARSARSTAIRL